MGRHKKPESEKYGRDRMSDKELARTRTITICDRFKISREAVRLWRKKRSLPTRGPTQKDAEKRKVDEYFGTEMTSRDIARKLGVSDGLVNKRFREKGRPTRFHNPALTWGRNRVSDEELATQTNQEIARRLDLWDSNVAVWRKVRGIPSPKLRGWALKLAIGKGLKRILLTVPDEELFGTSRLNLSEKYGCHLKTVTLERRRRRDAKKCG